MTDILKLRGDAAFSSARLERLRQRATAVAPKLRSLEARHWFFVEVSSPLSEAEQQRLGELLGVEQGGAQGTGDLLLIVPRLGTISPWSSKATDIAHQCGFDKVVRIERGIAFILDASRLDEGARSALLPLLHDRMTESVLQSLDAADALFHHYDPQPMTSVDI
ncbi:phosphoribosylformylglycinamidine synthase, partial [Azoarcus taiwanensis]|nr:phosphoribosylformylglycinamidine synthase [Azoarcus taiwanensis]